MFQRYSTPLSSQDGKSSNKNIIIKRETIKIFVCPMGITPKNTVRQNEQ